MNSNVHQARFWERLRMKNPFVEIRVHTEETGGSSTALHSHAFFEIIYIISGVVQYVLDGHRYKIKSADIILVPPEVSHCPLFAETGKEPYSRIVLWIDADFWRQCVAECPDLNFWLTQCTEKKSFVLRTNRATANGLYAGFQTILREFEQKRLCWEWCVRDGAIRLMAHISRTYYYLNAVAPTETGTLADNLFQYIDSNLRRKISLADAAAQFLVSTSTVSHLFKKELGISFYECVIQRRLIAAKNLMISGGVLHELWRECGFADYSSFYRAFKKNYGVCPSAYRSQYVKKTLL